MLYSLISKRYAYSLSGPKRVQKVILPLHILNLVDYMLLHKIITLCHIFINFVPHFHNTMMAFTGKKPTTLIAYYLDYLVAFIFQSFY